MAEPKEITLDNLIPAPPPEGVSLIRASEVQNLVRGVPEKKTFYFRDSPMTRLGVFSFSTTHNCPMIYAGDSYSFSIETGGGDNLINQGDALIPSSGLDLQGMTISAYRYDEDTAYIVIFNGTTNNINLANGFFGITCVPSDFGDRVLALLNKTAVFEGGVLTSLT